MLPLRRHAVFVMISHHGSPTFQWVQWEAKKGYSTVIVRSKAGEKLVKNLDVVKGTS